jgi:hypothetical protein
MIDHDLLRGCFFRKITDLSSGQSNDLGSPIEEADSHDN